MNTQNESSNLPGKKSSRKTKFVKRVLIVAAVVVVLLFFITPAFLSSKSGKKFVVNKINNSINGSVDMADLSMGWLKGVHLTDFRFEDDAKTTSVSVKEIFTKPYYSSLLFGQMAFGKTVIDTPHVKINLQRPGVKSASATALAKGKSASDSGGRGLEKIDLEVVQGSVAINRPDDSGKIDGVQFKNIEAKVDLKPPGSESAFDVSLGVSDGDDTSRISAKGKIKPAKKGWTLKGNTSDFSVKINNFGLDKLTPLFALVDKEINASGTLSADMTVKIDNGQVKEVKGKGVLAGFKKTIDGKEAVLDEPVKFEADISSDKKQIRIDKLKIESSFCRVNCNGDKDAIGYVATANLDGLQNFVGQFTDFGGYAVAGDIEAKGNLSFDKKVIKANGKTSIKGFSLSKADIKAHLAGQTNLSFDAYTDDKREFVHINSAKVTADIGDAEVSDSVVPLGKETKHKLGLKIKANVDLAKAAPFAKAFEAFDKDIEVGGNLKSEFSLNTEKAGFHIVTDNTSIENVRVAKTGSKPFEDRLIKLILDAILDFDEKTYEIKKLQIDSTDIDVTGNITQNTKNGRTRFAADLKAQYDLAAVSSMASPFIPEGLTMEGKRKNSINITSEYPEGQKNGCLANMYTKADFGFDKAEYKGLNFGPTETRVEVNKGVLTTKPFSTIVNKGTLRFDGGANFNTEPVMYKTNGPMKMIENIHITDDVMRNMLVYVNPIFAKQVNVSGTGNFDCEKFSFPLTKGHLKDTEISGTVWIDNLRLKLLGLPGAIFTNQGEFALEKTYFVLKDSVLRYDDMQLNIGDNPLNFAGLIDLENELYNLKVTLPYTRDRRTVNVGENVDNRISYVTKGRLKDGLRFDNLMQNIAEQFITGEVEKLIDEKVGEYLGEEGKRLLENIFKQ